MTEFVPYFSVVIPLYNKREYIARAVHSVLAQTFMDFELVVVDDGSTDGSQDALAGIVNDRVKVVRQENAGEGAARNRGIAEAQAPWVAFLDADDMWLPGHLEELSQIIEGEPEAGLISTGNVELANHVSLVPLVERRRVIQIVDYFAKAAQDVGFLNASSTAVKRDLALKLGGFGSAKAGADLEFWARIALTSPVATSSMITSIYFRGTGGVMERYRPVKSQQLRFLRDVSPSVELLDKALQSGEYAEKRPSIEAYMNSRLFSAIRASLYRRDVATARAVAGLTVGTPPVKLTLLSAALRMPAGIIRMGLGIRLFSRNLARVLTSLLVRL